MMPNKLLYQATLPYACAGIVVDQESGRIVEAAPIFKWAIGKQLSFFQSWVQRKRGTVVYVPSRGQTNGIESPTTD
jgi:hypothetical protein